MDESPPDDGFEDGASGLPGLDLGLTDDKTGAGHYRVLARKYRPETFSDLIGQEALVRTLTNAIATGRIAHAYMLTGIRGIGKTTTARLIARALNCVGPDGNGGPTINPCGVCEHCRAIAADRHVDVIEMDAASHTGVDDVREIIEAVRYAPATARYKVYIIDEVHMLTRNAFNALLKTLEEPPPHARFIFATTEIRKVPVTVLSRAQRFDLRRMPADLVATHLTTVAEKEKITLAEDAAAMLGRAADGSMRDGLSLLDQAIALGDGTVDQAIVADMLGLADRAVVIDLFTKLVSADIPGALDLARSMAAGGAEPLVIVQDLLDVTHFVTRCRFSDQAAADPGLPEADRTHGPALAKQLSVPVLTRLWQMLLTGIEEVSRAPDPSAALDMVIVRVIHAAGQPTPGELLKALREGRSNEGAPVPTPSTPAERQPEPVAEALPSQADTELPAMHADTERFAELMATFPETVDPEVAAHLRRDIRIVSCRERTLEIAVGERAPKNLVSRLNDILAEATGDRWMIAVVEGLGGQSILDFQEARTANMRAEAANHPLVKEILTTFDGATLDVEEGQDQDSRANQGQGKDDGAAAR
ncbi:MAG: DNA polymerase III subunit gamma/tau [Pseudomonadota bacterium]